MTRGGAKATLGGSWPPKSTAASVTLHNCKTPQNKTNTPAPPNLLSISGPLVRGDWHGALKQIEDLAAGKNVELLSQN